MPVTLEIRSCEVCGSQNLGSVLDLGEHPLCDDLMPINSPGSCNQYPIEILFCHTCRTAHQRFQVDKRLLFPRNYHYRSRLTADVVEGMRSLVEATELRLGSLHQKHVLDIGCNDGSLLAEFRQRGAKTIGIEPTAAGAEARQRGHAVTEAYLSPEVAEEVTRVHGRPDVITFTNVFAHIDSLAEVLHSLRIMMADQTVVVIENHYLGAIIDQCQFDTFYHEHPRTYSLTSFKHIANSLGRAILDVEFPKRYGGNIRVFIGAQARKDGVSQVGFIQRALASEANFGERLRAMPAQVARWKVRAKGRIDELLSSGPLVGKAFPGRAAILVKLLGLDIGNMNAVYEKPESPKIGNRLPGTQIPILSDKKLFEIMGQTPAVLNLAWHISPEIHSYLRHHGYRGQIVDILESSDVGDP